MYELTTEECSTDKKIIKKIVNRIKAKSRSGIVSDTIFKQINDEFWRILAKVIQ